jgi:glycosyltransferase involved in cell wall biosynthesis
LSQRSEMEEKSETVKKILFITPSAKSPFVIKDAATLSQLCPTEVLGVESLPFPRKLVLLLRLFSMLSRNEVRMIIMFFSVPLYAPFVVTLTKLFSIKVVVITGGYDTTYVPVIDWGEMKTWWKRVAQRYALSRVDLVLAFSDFSKADILKYARPKRIRTLNFGVDTEHFKPSGKKEALVLTVCFQVNASTLIQKGIRVMIESARAIPGAQFVINGKVTNDEAMNEARRLAPPNVIFNDRITTEDELLKLYQRAQVYVQVSAHEGFGIANVEAMSCGCIPVATNSTALPEVVGDAGFLVPFNDVAATTDAIRKALLSPELADKARARVVEHFTLDTRERPFLAEIQALLAE